MLGMVLPRLCLRSVFLGSSAPFGAEIERLCSGTPLPWFPRWGDFLACNEIKLFHSIGAHGESIRKLNSAMQNPSSYSLQARDLRLVSHLLSLCSLRKCQDGSIHDVLVTSIIAAVLFCEKQIILTAGLLISSFLVFHVWHGDLPDWSAVDVGHVHCVSDWTSWIA